MCGDGPRDEHSLLESIFNRVKYWGSEKGSVCAASGVIFNQRPACSALSPESPVVALFIPEGGYLSMLESTNFLKDQ